MVEKDYYWVMLGRHVRVVLENGESVVGRMIGIRYHTLLLEKENGVKVIVEKAKIIYCEQLKEVM